MVVEMTVLKPLPVEMVVLEEVAVTVQAEAAEVLVLLVKVMTEQPHCTDMITILLVAGVVKEKLDIAHLLLLLPVLAVMEQLIL